MNGVFPKLFSKGNVTTCISVVMEYLEESEKCHLYN